jgi:hypothetical protein
MRALKGILAGLGIVVAVIGLLFIGQGTGIFPYPQTSFMIGSATWVTRGSAMAAVGLLMVLVSRRIR